MVWPATNLPNRLIADLGVGKSQPRVLDVTTRTRQPRESTELIVNDIYELQVVRSELL